MSLYVTPVRTDVRTFLYKIGDRISTESIMGKIHRVEESSVRCRWVVTHLVLVLYDANFLILRGINAIIIVVVVVMTISKIHVSRTNHDPHNDVAAKS